MINRFAEQIEKTLSSDPVILSTSIQKHFGPDNKTVYIKGSVVLVDSSVLEIAIFAYRARNSVIVDKYRFHYMDLKERLVFRYDNAPHHREVDSFPHHKHLPDKVIRAGIPSLQNVLNEISAFILAR